MENDQLVNHPPLDWKTSDNYVVGLMTEVFIQSFSLETNQQTCIEQQHKDNE